LVEEQSLKLSIIEEIFAINSVKNNGISTHLTNCILLQAYSLTAAALSCASTNKKAYFTSWLNSILL